jgi:hypothetical protein
LLLSHVGLGFSKWSLFTCFPTKTLHDPPSVVHICHMPCPSHSLGIFFKHLVNSDLSGSILQNTQKETGYCDGLTTNRLVKVDFLYLFVVIKVEWSAHCKKNNLVLAGAAPYVLNCNNIYTWLN